MPQPVRAFRDTAGHAWLVLDNGHRIALPTGGTGGSGSDGGDGEATPAPDEVWVGSSPPDDPAVELWLDTDAEAGEAETASEVTVGTVMPVEPSTELWMDTNPVGAGSGWAEFDARYGAGDWQPYVCVPSGCTCSTIMASYSQVGQTVNVSIKATIATVTGGISFSLPVGCHTEAVSTVPGSARVVAGGTLHYAVISLGGATITVQSASGVNGGAVAYSPTFPKTWVPGDYIGTTFSYRAAVAA